jgi:hypothetical protein
MLFLWIFLPELKKTRLKYIFQAAILLIILFPGKIGAQNMHDSSLSFPIIGFQYSFNVPFGTLSKKFGVNSTVGASFWYKTSTNWLFGLEYNYIFGDQVKIDPLDSIKTSDGYILNSVGQFQDMAVYERGHFIMLKAGKIIKNLGPNSNSGLVLKGGAGFWMHQIFYYIYGDTPVQLQGNYMNGYDQLSYGPAISESFGYLNFSNNHMINFSAELEFAQGLTQNIRAYNFDTRMKDNAQHLDMSIGLKIAWYFPIYKKAIVNH